MGKYNLKKQEKEPKSIEDKVDSITTIKQLDEENPLERAIEYDMVKRNMPKKDYMKVTKKQVQVRDEEGNKKDFIVTESTQKDGKKLRFIEDMIRVVDLNTSILADIARCPSHVGPLLIDNYVKVNLEEKQEFKPEKRREIPIWLYLVLLLLMLPGILIAVFVFL